MATAPHTKLMIMIHKNGTGPTANGTQPIGANGYLGWRSWSLAAPNPLSDFFNRTNPGRWPYSPLTNGTIGANVGALNAIEAVVRPAGDLDVNAVFGNGNTWDITRVRTATYCSAAVGSFASSGT
jgi:hypothetical protein